MLRQKFLIYHCLLIATTVAVLLTSNYAQLASAQDIIPRATPPVPLPGADPSMSPPNAKPPMPTVSFHASRDIVPKGKPITLSWATTNATRVFLSVGDGGPQGSRTVFPDTSTSYSIIAIGPGGTASAIARVTVSDSSDLRLPKSPTTTSKPSEKTPAAAPRPVPEPKP